MRFLPQVASYGSLQILHNPESLCQYSNTRGKTVIILFAIAVIMVARAVFICPGDQGFSLLPARIFFVVEMIHRRFRSRWRKTKNPRRRPDQSWRLEISAAGRITVLKPVSCSRTVYFSSPVIKQIKKVIPMRRSTSQFTLTLSIRSSFPLPPDIGLCSATGKQEQSLFPPPPNTFCHAPRSCAGVPA